MFASITNENFLILLKAPTKTPIKAARLKQI